MEIRVNVTFEQVKNYFLQHLSAFDFPRQVTKIENFLFITLKMFFGDRYKEFLEILQASIADELQN